MTVVAITAVIGLVLAIAAIVWLAKRGDTKSDQRVAEAKEMAAVRIELGEKLNAKTLEAERSVFELSKANTTLAVERQRIAALEDYVASQAGTVDSNADLADDDVAGRLLRLSRRLGSVASEAHPERRGAVLAEPDNVVSTGEPTGRPGPDDLLRPE